MSNNTVTVTQSTNSVSATQTSDTVTVSSSGSIGLIGGGTIEGALNVGVDGTGHDVKFFGATAGKYMQWDQSADKLFINGELEVNGGATTFNSTVITIDDPIFSLGGQQRTDALDDSKDRGLEFFYHDGAQKTGFMGYDDSADSFTFLTSATNSHEVFSGTAATVQMGHLNFVEGSGGQIQFNGTEKINIGTNNIGLRKPIYGMTGTVDIGLSSNPFRDGHFSGTVKVPTIGTESGNLTLAPAGTYISFAGKRLYGSNVGLGYHLNAVSAQYVALGTGIDSPTASLSRTANGTIALGNGTQNDSSGTLLAGNVTVGAGSAGSPSLTFSSDSDTGFFNRTAGELNVAIGGSWIANFQSTGLKIYAGTGIFNRNGSAAAPSFTFSDDTNTGMYRKGADALGFSTGGTERVSIDSSGVLADTYTVKDGASALSRDGDIFRIHGTSGIDLTTWLSSSYHAALSVRKSATTGLIGINQTSPTAPLHIGGGVSDTYAKIGYYWTFASNRLSSSGALKLNAGSGEDLHLQENGTDRLIVKHTTGRVGIGESNPQNLLHVKANNAVGPTIELQNSQFTSYINAWGSSAMSGRQNRVEINATASDFAIGSDTIRFQIGNVGDTHEKMRIHSDGNVGIGVAAPAAALHVSKDSGSAISEVAHFVGGGSTDDKTQITVGGNTSSALVSFGFRNTGSGFGYIANASDAEVLTIDGGNSRVGIGTTAPARKFHVNSGALDVGIRLESSDELAKIELQDNGGTAWLGAKSGGLHLQGGGSDTVGSLVVKDGNVGIGTAAPSELLHVSSATSHKPVVVVENTNADSSGTFLRMLKNTASPAVNDSIGSLQYQSNNDQGSGRVYAQIAARIHDPVAATATGELKFNTFVNGTDTTVMTMLDGKVGVNNTSPLYTLDVTGGIRFSSSSVANGDMTFMDGKKANFGNSTDFQIQHSSNHNHLTSLNGDIRFTTNSSERLRIDENGLVRVFGDLQVDGTTTTFNSTTVTVDDPVLTLGGDTAPSSDDNKDRGVEFRYYDGSAKVGFMGWDDSAGGFTLLKDATNSSEVFSGTAASLVTGAISTSGNISITGDKSILNQGDAAKGSIRFYDQSGGIIMLNGGTTNPLRFDSHVKFLADKSIQDGDGNTIFNFYTSAYDGVSAPILRFASTMALEGANAPSFLSRDNIVLRIDSNNDSTSNYFSVEANAGTELFRIKEDGKVGIGTTSPDEKFHVHSSGAAKLKLESSGTSDTQLIFENSNRRWFTYQDSVGKYIIADNTAGKNRIQIPTDGSMSFDTNSATALQISSAGKVGIGTTAPASTLQVKSGSSSHSALIGRYGNDDGLFLHSEAGSSHYNWMITTQDNVDKGFEIIPSTAVGNQTFSTPAFVIKADTGNVGIGTTAPLGKLHVHTADAGSFTYDTTADDFIVESNANGGMTIATAAANTGRIIFASPDDATGAEISYSQTGALMKVGPTSANNADLVLQAGQSTEFLRLDAGDDQTVASKDIRFQDNVKARFGSGSDMQVYHNGTNSVITNATGNLYIENTADDGDIIFQSDDGSGGVETYFYLDGSVGSDPHTVFPDGANLALGSSADAVLLHNGTNTYFQNFTGDLEISNYANDKDILFRCDDGSGGIETYFFLDGSASSGNPHTTFPDNSFLNLGDSRDLQMSHNGTDSVINNKVGDLYIQTTTDDGDIIFQCDDGSGGVATYLTIDGGAEETVAAKHIRFNDDVQARFGSGADANILHNDTDWYIQNSKGHLYINNYADDKDIIFKTDDGSGGQTAYMTIDGSGTRTNFHKNVKIEDSVTLGVGNGFDLSLLHDGTDSFVQNATGDLTFIQNADDKDIIFQSDDGSGGVAEYLRFDGGYSDPQIRVPDNVQMNFGSSLDLRIIHDGSNSYISSNGTGDFYIRQLNDDKDIIFQCDDGSGGTATYMTLDGSQAVTTLQKRLRAEDGVNLELGTGADFQLVHSGTQSSITNATGNLTIQQGADDCGIIFMNDNGSGGVTEYFRLDGSQADGTNVYTRFADNSRIALGASNDFQLYHNGSSTRLVQNTGNLSIEQQAADSDIVFQADDGSGGITPYITIDGSAESVVFNKTVQITGNLQVDGTTQTINSTVVTIDDPILTLGGDTAPSSDDNNDRGIEFRYYDGSAKVGFMGWDDSAGGFTFLKAATNSSEVFSGTAASLTTGAISAGGNLTMGGNQITGVSVLGGSGSNLQINAANGEHFIYGSQDAQVLLYYNGIARLETSATGIEVSGRAVLDQLSDDNGIKINGYDDKSGENLQAYVRSTGNSRIDATRALNLFSGESYGGGIGSGTTSGVTWDAFNQFTFTAESNARIPLSIEGAASQTGDLLNITSNGGSAGDLLTVDSSGKVGVGTTSPAFPIHLNGASTATLAIQCNGNNAEGSKIRLIEGSSNFQGGFIHYDGSANALNIGVHANNNTTLSEDVNAITIPRDTGKVGIGVASPVAKLHVVGDTASDAASLGSEIVASQTASGTNWSGSSIAAGYTHADGSTDPLVTTLTPTANRVYRIEIETTNVTAGRLDKVSIGGHDFFVYITNNQSRVFSVNTSSTAALTFESQSEFVGTVTVNSVKEVADSDSLSVLSTSSGSGLLEMRVAGHDTFFLGRDAGENTLTATNNIGIGDQALRNSCTQGINLAVGNRSLTNLTAGSYNVAIGHDVLGSYQKYGNTYNIGIGNNVMDGSSNTGQQNIVMGFWAGANITSASSNIGIGYSVYNALTSGTNNVSLGDQSLYSLTTGGNNVAVGNYALRSLTTSASNTAVGYYAGRYVVGNAANETGSQSVFLGYNAKAAADGQANQIVIGASAEGIGANTVTLGNDSIVTTALKGNVGIGVTAPATKVHILNGTGNDPHIRLSDPNSASTNSATGYLEVYHGNTTGRAAYFGMITNAEMALATTTSNGNFRVYTGNNQAALTIDSSQNVGIGTTAPDAKLHVEGTNNEFVQLIRTANNNAATLNEFSSYYSLSIKNRTSGSFLNFSGDGNYSSLQATDGAGSAAAKIISLNPFGGNVAIGQTTAGYKLDVDGDIRIKDTHNLLIGDGADFQIQHNTSDTFITNLTGDVIFAQSADNGDILFQSDNGSGGNTNYLVIDGGNERINFAKPTQHADGVYLYMGSDNDFDVRHNGSDFQARCSTGDMVFIQADSDQDMVFQCDNGSGSPTPYITLDGSQGFTTLQKHLTAEDNVNLQAGTDGDLRIFFNGNGNIANVTGDLVISNSVANREIFMRGPDGSGGTTNYLTLDGSGAVTFQKPITSVAASTSLLATDIKIGEDDQTKIDFGNANQIDFYANNSQAMVVSSDGYVGIGTAAPVSGLQLHNKAITYSCTLVNDANHTTTRNDTVVIFHSMTTYRYLTLATNDCVAGRMIHVKNRDNAQYVYIQTEGSQTIDGESYIAGITTTRGSITLVSDGSNWSIISKYTG